MRLLLLLAALALGGAGAAYLWVHHALALRTAPADLSVEPGMSVRQMAQQVQQAGVEVSPELLYWWFRLSGQDRQMRAGSYLIEQGDTRPMRDNRRAMDDLRAILGSREKLYARADFTVDTSGRTVAQVLEALLALPALAAA